MLSVISSVKLSVGSVSSVVASVSVVTVSSVTVVSACVDSTVAGTDSVVAAVSCLPQEAKDKIHTVIKMTYYTGFIKDENLLNLLTNNS